MGELLKPRVLSVEHARKKLKEDIAAARARYERRLKNIAEQEAEIKLRFKEGEPKLSCRASNTLSSCLCVRKPNPACPEHLFLISQVAVTPEAASKLTAKEILKQPNCGHKTINEIAIWLRFHGYQLAA